MGSKYNDSKRIAYMFDSLEGLKQQDRYNSKFVYPPCKHAWEGGCMSDEYGLDGPRRCIQVCMECGKKRDDPRFVGMIISQSQEEYDAASMFGGHTR